jgi:transposase
MLQAMTNDSPLLRALLAELPELPPERLREVAAIVWGRETPRPPPPAPAHDARRRKPAQRRAGKKVQTTDKEEVREARDRAIFERVMAGETQTALAIEFGICRDNVSRIVRGLGLPSRRRAKEVREEQDRAIRARVKVGETRDALAAEFGLSTASVHKIVKGHRARWLPANHWQRWPDELSQEAVALRAEGLSHRQIADRLHKTTGAVKEHLRLERLDRELYATEEFPDAQ